MKRKSLLIIGYVLSAMVVAACAQKLSDNNQDNDIESQLPQTLSPDTVEWASIELNTFAFPVYKKSVTVPEQAFMEVSKATQNTLAGEILSSYKDQEKTEGGYLNNYYVGLKIDQLTFNQSGQDMTLDTDWFKVQVSLSVIDWSSDDWFNTKEERWMKINGTIKSDNLEDAVKNKATVPCSLDVYILCEKESNHLVLSELSFGGPKDYLNI